MFEEKGYYVRGLGGEIKKRREERARIMSGKAV